MSMLTPRLLLRKVSPTQWHISIDAVFPPDAREMYGSELLGMLCDLLKQRYRNRDNKHSVFLRDNGEILFVELSIPPEQAWILPQLLHDFMITVHRFEKGIFQPRPDDDYVREES